MHDSRNMPVGAEVQTEGVAFRVWAPECKNVDVVVEGAPEPIALRAEDGGYFSGVGRGLRAGALYRYRLDGKDAFPDPASRSQPQGPHGPSEVVDPSAYRWSDGGWQGLTLAGQVLYELHIGTFTREGSFDSARAQLAVLAELGVTAIELMPVAEFAGGHGWGYDGVDLFAPCHLYGVPDDLRRFVDEAHSFGVGVILDVVYNHLGADGNYLPKFSDSYFTDRHPTDWGAAINFDGAGSEAVRELVLANAAYWIREFHLDGLRLDATQNIYDDSDTHIIAEICTVARAAAAPRGILIVGENEQQKARLLRGADAAGYGLDALWNDDFHHTARVALTGKRMAYYTDYGGTPQELTSSARRGFLYQGQRYEWQKQRRGTPTAGIPRVAFISFLQNHDQVANSSRGTRLHALASPGRYRALTAFWLLGPATPLLFQGQEFAASTPFLYFADLDAGLTPHIRAGRREFLAQFTTLALPEWDDALPDPVDRRCFESSILDHRERTEHHEAYALHKDLLRLRRSDPVITAAHEVDGAVLSHAACVLRLFGPEGDDRLLLLNMGPDLRLPRAPEPLLAPPEGRSWSLRFGSDARAYGGDGTLHPEIEGGWHLPGEAAVLLAAERTKEKEA